MTAAALHLGSDFAGLVRMLAEGIAAHRDAAGPLAPVDVVVATRALRHRLPMELAALTGASANIRWHSPAALGAPGFPAPPLLRARLYAALSDASLLAGAPVLRAFLERENAEERRDLRRHTLAGRIARTFAAYRDSWPEAADSLERAADDPHMPAARWQRLLWERTVAIGAGVQSPSPLASKALFVFDIPRPGRGLLDTLTAVIAEGVTVQILGRPAVEGASDKQRWGRHGLGHAKTLARWSSLAPSVHGATATARTVPSLQCIAAPSQRRACEAVAAQLWRWVESDGGLRFHDLAIAVPEGVRDELLPVLREVLSEAHGLPKVVWNLPMAGQARVASLARLLLELPTGPLRRSDVLGVLTHPLVTGAFADDLPEEWPAWLDAVGVFHGIDDVGHEGTYLEGRHVAHWDQGLTRLALGAFLGSARSGRQTSFADGDARFVPEERTQSSQPAIGLLLSLVRSLLSDAAAIASLRMTPGEWRILLDGYLQTYVRPTSNEDRQLLGAVRGALAALDDEAVSTPVPYPVAQAVALEALAAMSGDAGGQLTQGIVIATPGDLRGLPLKRLAFLGLEAAHHPARPRRSDLDLRPEAAAQDDDPYTSDAETFFDLVTNTTEEVLLAYAARHPVTGEKQEPSPLVRDLVEHVGRSAVIFRSPPLLRRDEAAKDEAFARVFPEARAEAVAHTEGAAVRKAAAGGQARHVVPEGARALLATPALPDAAKMERPVVEVSLDDLVKFLECPPQGYARFHLRMRQDEEERTDEVDETFAHDALTDASVLGGALSRLLTTHPLDLMQGDALDAAVVEAYDAVLAAHAASGRTPHALFEEVQRAKDLDALARAVVAVRRELEDALGESLAEAATLCRWGRAEGDDVVPSAPRPPPERDLELPGGRRQRVRIVGRSTPGLPQGAIVRFKRDLGKMVTRNAWAEPLRRQHALRGWVEQCVLALDRGRAPALFDATVDKSGAMVIAAFRAMDAAEAGRSLDLVLTDLLTHPVGFKAPAAALFHAWEQTGASVPEADRLVAVETSVDEAYNPTGPIIKLGFSVVRGVDQLPLPDGGELDRTRGHLVRSLDARSDLGRADGVTRSVKGARTETGATE